MKFFDFYKLQFKFHVEGKAAKSVSSSRFCNIQLHELSCGHFFSNLNTELYY